jgi:hypothetical protein
VSNWFATLIPNQTIAKPLGSFLRLIAGTVRDIAPIVIVIAFFQLAVLQQPFPNLDKVIIGLLFVMVGLALFIKGLEMGLFPLGESLAQDFARKGNIWWLVIFAFGLGFGTTVAEPALIAVADKAAEAAAEAGKIPSTPDAMAGYAQGLRLTVAVSVGAAIVLGVIRILKGWPLHWIVIGGYVLVVAMTYIAPESIIGIAYDSGGVTTSTITVPLVTALGVGLSTVIRGRNPMIDGFGLIALASLTPMIFVMVYGAILY